MNFNVNKIGKLHFKTEKIELNNQFIQVYQFGQGKKIVLAFPGYPSSGFMYLWTFKDFLIDDYKFITFDIPGWLGFSKDNHSSRVKFSIDNVIGIASQVLDHYKINDKFSLLGYSFGGAISLKMAGIYPERIKKIALISPVLTSQYIEYFWKELIEIAELFRLSFAVRIVIDQYVIRRTIRSLQERNISKKYLGILNKSLKGIDNKVLKDALYEILHVDLTFAFDKINSLSIPILVVNSKEELRIFKKQAEYIRRKLKHEESVYKIGRHEDFALKPDKKVNEEILNFLS